MWGTDLVRLSIGPADALWIASVWGKSAHAVVFAGESVLLVRERNGDWHFPGGRTDNGETLEQALTREMWEEGGATLCPHPVIFAAVRVHFSNRTAGPRGDSYIAYFVAELASLTDEYAGDPALTEQQIAERRMAPVMEAGVQLDSFNQCLLKEALAWCQRSVAEP